MKPNRSEAIKYRFLVTLLVASLFLFACFLTLIININKNKGMFYLIFVILAIYSILMFLYNILCESKIVNHSIKYNVKFIYLVFFFINILLSILSFLVL